MSSNKKHSKIKNTGILFELLTRQITVDVLNSSEESSAIKILKEFFNPKTELGKEYELYKILLEKKYGKSEEFQYPKLQNLDFCSKNKILGVNIFGIWVFGGSWPAGLPQLRKPAAKATKITKMKSLKIQAPKP